MKQNTIFYIRVIVVMLFLFPHFVSNAMGRYISGEIQLTYRNNEIESNSMTATQSSLEQKYQLNYSRYWLSPRLFTYLLSGTYTQEDGETDSSTFESEALNYNILLEFLQGSAIPFRIHAYRNTSSAFNSLMPSLEQTLTGLELRGAVKMRKSTRLRYWVTQADRERTGRGDLQDERTRKLHLDLSKKWKRVSADLAYDYRNELNRLTGSEIDSHLYRVNVSSHYRLSKFTKLSLRSNGVYDQLNEHMGINASANLKYRPSSRFRGENGTKFSYTNDPDGSDITVRNNTLAEYRINRNLRSRGQVSLSSSSGSSGEKTSESVHGSLSYSALLPAKIKFAAGTGAGYAAYQREENNGSSYNANISSSIGKSFRRTRSQLNASANASYANSSAGDNSYKYIARIDGSNNYIKRLRARAYAKYSVENQGNIGEESTTISGHARLTYNLPLNWRARMNFSASALIERGDAQKESFSAGQSFTYLLLRNLYLTESSNYSMEPASDSTLLQADADIMYRLRRIFLSIEYEFRMEDNRDTSITISSLKIQATRKF